jgi:hypothetical protein
MYRVGIPRRTWRRGRGRSGWLAMVLRASHGRPPTRPNRVPRASCLPRTMRPRQRTQGHRGRFAAPAPNFPWARGRARPVVHSQCHRTVREPVPAHGARRSRLSRSGSPAGTGGIPSDMTTAARAGRSR